MFLFYIFLAFDSNLEQQERVVSQDLVDPEGPSRLERGREAATITTTASPPEGSSGDDPRRDYHGN